MSLRRLSLVLLGACALLLAAAAPAGPGKTKAATPLNPKVAIETSKGSIVLELYPDKAPATVQNFLDYVKAGHYDGLVFHRVIDGFMIQGGGFTPDLMPRQVRAPIKLEAGRGLSNLRGTLAMARTSDPDSATSQFFINLVDNVRLDSYGGGYAVFGKVIEGMPAVDAIAKVKTAPQQGQQNAPVEAVVIKRARLL